MPSKDKHTVLLPTYNERDNIAIVVWLLIRTFTARQAAMHGSDCSFAVMHCDEVPR